jgi:hypothetical protein
MSFIANKTGIGYAPGWFLAEEECSRETRTIAQNHSQVVTGSNGAKHVPMGAFWPANDSSTVKGIVYEDVDVTSGAMPGSVVTKGVVYLDRLPASPESGVQSALEGLGFKFYSTAPTVTRPNFNKTELDTITVASTAGTGAGKTDVALSGYTPAAGESYAYKIGAAAPAAWLGMQIDNTWTKATFPLDELTATTGQYITVVSVDSTGAVVAAGSDDITANA